MPLSKNIEDQILALSKHSNSRELIDYLIEKLVNREINLDDLLDYAKTTKAEKSLFVMDADCLYALGLKISALIDIDLKRHSIRFHQLSAERSDIKKLYQERIKFSWPEQEAENALVYVDALIKQTEEEQMQRCYSRVYDHKASYHAKIPWPEDANEKRRAQYACTFSSSEKLPERAALLKEQISANLTIPTPPNITLSSSELFLENRSHESTWFDAVDPSKLSIKEIDDYARERRHIAESHFFNPARSKKKRRLEEISNGIIDQRYRKANATQTPISLENKNARQMISAEKAFQNAAISLSNEKNPKLGIPVVDVKTKIQYGPDEHYEISKTKIRSKHKAIPHRNRLGDTRVSSFGSYRSVYRDCLRKLSNEDLEKEKKLAELIIQYGKNHKAISLEELKCINPIASDADVSVFNHFCFLIIDKEPAQWLSAIEKQYQAGFSVSHARCLLLLKEGIIHFKEVFDENPTYGIYSQKSYTDWFSIGDGFTSAIAACKRIDTLYLAYLQKKHATDHFSFIKKYIDHPKTPILTLEQAHQDMRSVYGGDSDTDNEVYTDTPIATKRHRAERM